MNWSWLSPQLPLVEHILRPLAVFVFLVAAFRIAGKRELGQMKAVDLVVLLTISNIVQNAMIGNDSSLGGGLLGAFVLLSANGVLAHAEARWPRLATWLEGAPTLLIQDGQVLEDNMRKEVMARPELCQAMRAHGLDPDDDLRRVRRAYLEVDGSVSILLAGPA